MKKITDQELINNPNKYIGKGMYWSAWKNKREAIFKGTRIGPSGVLLVFNINGIEETFYISDRDHMFWTLTSYVKPSSHLPEFL